jgi:putative ABC transport system ATP-binding protein
MRAGEAGPPRSIVTHNPARPILTVQHITKAFRSGERNIRVLDDVSFEVAAGSTCAVVGPSGSGKTTLMGICAGLDRPDSGIISLDGNDLNRFSEDQLATVRQRDVGFVFQTFQLIPTLTALENVMVPLELAGIQGPSVPAMELLDRVGLDHRGHHYPNQLSGGEQQRVALARAFIHKPKILFADEPTGNLDNETAKTVVPLLFELNRTTGTTLVIVTHNLDIADLTQNIIRLRGGKIIEL